MIKPLDVVKFIDYNLVYLRHDLRGLKTLGRVLELTLDSLPPHDTLTLEEVRMQLVVMIGINNAVQELDRSSREDG